jgi:hypothetical protein
MHACTSATHNGRSPTPEYLPRACCAHYTTTNPMVRDNTDTSDIVAQLPSHRASIKVPTCLSPSASLLIQYQRSPRSSLREQRLECQQWGGTAAACRPNTSTVAVAPCQQSVPLTTRSYLQRHNQLGTRTCLRTDAQAAAPFTLQRRGE